MRASSVNIIEQQREATATATGNECTTCATCAVRADRSTIVRLDARACVGIDGTAGRRHTRVPEKLNCNHWHSVIAFSCIVKAIGCMLECCNIDL